MKRRTFIGGLFASIGLLGTSLKASEKKPVVLSEEEEFYKFFETFNGFPINPVQKGMYKFYKNGYTSNWYPRRAGVSTFMITLTAWEAIRGNNVIHFSSTQKLTDIVSRDFKRKMGGRLHANVDFVNIHRKIYPLKSLRYDIAFLDQSHPFYHEEWIDILPSVQKSLLLKTQEAYV